MTEFGLHLDELPRLEREGFLHFTTLARRCEDLEQWPVFRDALVVALTAAFGLDSVWADRDREQETTRVAERRRRASALIDEAAARYDPLSQWPHFREALWNGRHPLMVPPAAA